MGWLHSEYCCLRKSQEQGAEKLVSIVASCARRPTRRAYTGVAKGVLREALPEAVGGGIAGSDIRYEARRGCLSVRSEHLRMLSIID